MFGLFKPAKSHKLTIEGVGDFVVNPKETILSAALRQGVRFPHSCKVGGCATCKCQIKEGKVKELTAAAFILSAEDLQKGYVLGCQSQLKSDVVIHVDSLSDSENAAKLLDGKITAKEGMTHDITKLTIELNEETNYLPGQYALVSTPAITTGARSYSYAAPAKGNQVSFFIRQVPNGEMSGWANQQADVGDSVTIDGPHGDFYLRQGEGDILMIAGGSGIAPILAILEDALQFKTSRNVTFLFGARTQADLCALEQIKQIEQNWSGVFRFIPVLSEEADDSGWEGERGLVTELIPSVADKVAQTYMCGPPLMLDAAEALLKEHKLSPEGIYCDRFLDRSSGA
jgi:3-phenylpropionate/trans-cinnamate dioxygenase ferredoxin reductase subunit